MLTGDLTVIETPWSPTDLNKSSSPHCGSSHRSNTLAQVPPRLKNLLFPGYRILLFPARRICSKACGAIHTLLMICCSSPGVYKLSSLAVMSDLYLIKYPTIILDGQLLEIPVNKQWSPTASWQEVPAASTELQHPPEGSFRGSSGNRQLKFSIN